MSGPALRQLHAHRSIHEGGLSGAVTKTSDMMDIVCRVMKENFKGNASM